MSALPLSPVEARYQETVELARRGEYESALDTFRKLSEEDPTHIGCFGQMAYLHELADRLPEAIECYERILQIDPEMALARYRLANTAYAHRDRAKAREHYARLRGTKFFDYPDTREKAANTEFFSIRLLKESIPLLARTLKRSADGPFRRAVLAEVGSIPSSLDAIREVGWGAYLTYFRKRFLESDWYKHPIRLCDCCGHDGAEPVFFIAQNKVVRCLSCGFVTVERKPPQGLDVFTDKYSQDSTVEDFESLGWRDEKVQRERLDLLAKLFGRIGKTFPQTSGCAFEIGIGEGYFLKTLEDEGYETGGIETSNRLVEFAKKELGLDVWLGTVESIEPTDKKYDLVLAYHVLEHLDEPSLLFSKARDLLREGGLLFLELPVSDLQAMPFAKKIDNMIGYGNLYHMNYFTEEKVREYFESSGFERVESYILYPDTHPTGGFLGRVKATNPNP